MERRDSVAEQLTAMCQCAFRAAEVPAGKLTQRSCSPVGAPGGRDRPDTQLLLWEGAVPAQKWMTLYTKALTTLVAADADLKISVRVEASLPSGQAEAAKERMRSALRELGLSEGVEVR